LSTDKHVAAVDLGSNSFHMVIAEEGEHGNIQPIDRVKEMVRLGAGLDDYGYLSMDAQQVALDCLERFGQRLRSIPTLRTRAVGTNTLRAAKNSGEFLKRAESALGHPISIISGHEEARLVYLGAAFDLATSGNKRLVVDIGGGSTELIIGTGYTPVLMDSLYMGCVSVTRRFFPDGKINQGRFRNAENFVFRELETVTSSYRQFGWDEVVGTSGTIKAIDQLALDLGLNQDWISSESISEIKKWILDSGNSEYLDYVADQRRPVFVGGFIILGTIFKAFQIERMDTSEGALREGVAYDLIDRLHNEDSRFQGVKSLLAQFKTDHEQSERIENAVSLFMRQVEDKWKLTAEIDQKLLLWAAQLHEIGISISYSHYNMHSAYIIENSNIDGFSRQVQRVLALLVLNHRQKIDIEQIRSLSDGWRKKVKYLTVLLRLAVAFYRGRSDVDLTMIKLEPGKNKLDILIPHAWVESHPLTVFDLETEQGYLKSMNFDLGIRSDMV